MCHPEAVGRCRQPRGLEDGRAARDPRARRTPGWCSCRNGPSAYGRRRASTRCRSEASSHCIPWRGSPSAPRARLVARGTGCGRARLWRPLRARPRQRFACHRCPRQGAGSGPRAAGSRLLVVGRVPLVARAHQRSRRRRSSAPRHSATCLGLKSNRATKCCKRRLGSLERVACESCPGAGRMTEDDVLADPTAKLGIVEEHRQEP